jgi:NAD(P)-dependent dehydrogenase (short-subunit alcohol dehydrogenase family)
MNENEKVALVTASGKGMGAAIARELSSTGYKLGLMSLSDASINLADELGGFGLQGSVTEPVDLERLVQGTMARYGRIDAVVNHTGHPPKGALLDIPDEDWHGGLDLVMLNVVRMSRLVTPIMQAQGGGAIVNISTFAVFEPSPIFPVSVSMRAALAAFSKLYSDQYAADGIRMNNLLPGFVNSLPENPDWKADIPMGRYGTVEEIAKTTRFLLSDESSYITGQNLRVDGGLTRSV